MPRPKGDIEDRILAAARHRFIHDGVDGSSLRDIARAAGTSIGMVYYYFPSKDDLFLAVVEQAYVELLKDLGTALANDVSVEARILRLYERIARVTDHEVEVLRLIAREALVSSSRLDRLIERFKRGHVPMVLATLGEGYGDGTIRTDVHPLLAFFATFAFGAIPQFAYRYAASKLPFTDLPRREELPKQLLNVLFHGLGGDQKSAAAAADPPTARRPRRRTNRQRGS
jgi:AcrR family transcriptional regulator